MCKKIVISFLFAFMVSRGFSQYAFNQYDTLKTAHYSGDMGQILEQAELEFSKKLNDLRTKRKRKKIRISKHATIAAFNHSLWMSHHNSLTHRQKMGSEKFSGVSILNRLNFVRMINMIAHGENVAYIHFKEINFHNHEEAIDYIAQAFYDTWYSSPGHRKNMLDKDYSSHGIAFVFFNGKVFGTNIFIGS